MMYLPTIISLLCIVGLLILTGWAYRINTKTPKHTEHDAKIEAGIEGGPKTDDCASYPYYGLAPHIITDKGRIAFLYRETWPDNFSESTQIKNQGVYYCPESDKCQLIACAGRKPKKTGAPKG